MTDKDINDLLTNSNDKKKQSSNSSWLRYVPFIGSNKKKTDDDESQEIIAPAGELYVVDKGFNKKKPVYVNDENIQQYIFPRCCHPIPGDDILGYIDNKNRIEIHERACPVASKLKASFGNRILDAKWDMHKSQLFDATIQIQGIDRKGLLHDLADIISDQMNVNMRKIIISSDNGIFDGSIELRVHDRDEVKLLMESLKKVQGLQQMQHII
jgi:GTP pyrophosphokinase